MKENSFFASIRRTGWVRPEDRWVGGVCAELARKSGWDVSLIRGVAVLAILFLWFPLALYGIAWLLIPDARSGQILLQHLFAGRFEIAQVGAIAAVVIGLLGFPFWSARFFVTAGLVILLVILVQRANASPPPANRPAPHTTKGAPTVNSSSNPYSAGPQRPHNNPPAPPPNPYSAPRPTWQPAPRMSNTLGLGALGIIFLAGAALAAGSHALGYSFGLGDNAFAWGAWCSLTLIIMGVALAITALRGRKGGWFLGVSIVTAIFLFPIGTGAAGWRTYETGSWGWEGAFHSGDFYTESAEHTVFASNQTFDHTVQSINADASTLVLDLTGAPEDYPTAIRISLDASTLQILTRDDQEISLDVDSELSSIHTEGIDLERWSMDGLPRAGSFAWNAGTSEVTEDSIDLAMDITASSVTIEERHVSPGLHQSSEREKESAQSHE